MKLLPEEQNLDEFGSLALTSHRIRKTGGYDKQRWRVREVASIRLEHITHCQIITAEQPVLIVAGLLIIIAGTIGGAYWRAEFIIVIGLVLGVFAIIGYYTSQVAEIEIASPTLALRHQMRKKNLEEAMDFIDTVERAASERSDSRRGHMQYR